MFLQYLNEVRGWRGQAASTWIEHGGRRLSGPIVPAAADDRNRVSGTFLFTRGVGGLRWVRAQATPPICECCLAEAWQMGSWPQPSPMTTATGTRLACEAITRQPRVIHYYARGRTLGSSVTATQHNMPR